MIGVDEAITSEPPEERLAVRRDRRLSRTGRDQPVTAGGTERLPTEVGSNQGGTAVGRAGHDGSSL